MSSNHLSQASDVHQNTKRSNERSTNSQHALQWTKNVLICFSCVVVCIVVLGAIDLYWHLVWQYTSDVLTRGGTSLWPSCILGVVAALVEYIQSLPAATLNKPDSGITILK